ncbi:MAG: PIN domain-containing protein [Bacteroidetes bacterium]|jgi:predicted nucleic acid-binding protein|nr:PIN domain-containing protein [Bacteroidota bacterium]
MYIDTSCLAAYYLPEPKSDTVQEIIQQNDAIVISYVTEIELLSAIRKRHRMGELSEDDGTKTWTLFKNHRKSGLFDIAELDASVFKSAELLMKTTSTALRSLDAIHLGIAYAYGFDLYTFDNTMIRVANEFNIELV